MQWDPYNAHSFAAALAAVAAFAAGIPQDWSFSAEVSGSSLTVRASMGSPVGWR